MGKYLPTSVLQSKQRRETFPFFKKKNIPTYSNKPKATKPNTYRTKTISSELTKSKTAKNDTIQTLQQNTLPPTTSSVSKKHVNQRRNLTSIPADNKHPHIPNTSIHSTTAKLHGNNGKTVWTKRASNKRQDNIDKHNKQKINKRYGNKIQIKITNVFDQLKNKKANLTKTSTQNPMKTRNYHIKPQNCNTHKKENNGSTEKIVNQQVQSSRNNRDPEVYYDTKYHK